MGRPRTVSDAQVLEAARRVFVAKGYGASTREIARSAGLSQAALFQRFADKPSLFLAALVPAPIDVLAVVGPLRDAAVRGALDVVQSMTARLLEAMREIVPLLTALSTSPELDRAVLAAAHERLQGETLFANLSVAFTRWQRDGDLPAHLDPEGLIEAILVAVHGVLLMSRSAHFASVDAERAALSRTVAAIWGAPPARDG